MLGGANGPRRAIPENLVETRGAAAEEEEMKWRVFPTQRDGRLGRMATGLLLLTVIPAAASAADRMVLVENFVRVGC